MSSSACVEAGADVDGEGDDHALGVLGWATCFGDVREEVAAYLLSKGARLSIFSAIALDRGDDVRAMVAAEPDLLSRRMSRNEHGRLPLHHAVVCDRPAMVELLLALGADANAADLTGAAPIAYARRPAIVQMLHRRRRAPRPDRRADARALRPGRGHARAGPDAARAGRTRYHRAAHGGRPAQRGGGALADRARRRRQCQARALRLQPHGAARVRRARPGRHRHPSCCRPGRIPPSSTTSSTPTRWAGRSTASSPPLPSSSARTGGAVGAKKAPGDHPMPLLFAG